MKERQIDKYIARHIIENRKVSNIFYERTPKKTLSVLTTSNTTECKSACLTLTKMGATFTSSDTSIPTTQAQLSTGHQRSHFHPDTNPLHG